MGMERFLFGLYRWVEDGREPKIEWVDASMQAIRPAFALAAAMLTLQGCAGVNELAYGELFRLPESNPASSSEFVPQATLQASTMASSGQSEMAANSSLAISSSVASASALEMNDPINAPPPPMAMQSLVVEAPATEVNSRPMMLVPAPGQSLETFSSAMSMQPNAPVILKAPAMPAQVPALAQESTSVPMLDSPLLGSVSALAFKDSDKGDELSAGMPSVRPETTLSMGREFIPASVSPITNPSKTVMPGEIRLTRGQQNVLKRFAVLERLLDEGLVTRNERDLRRIENIGAILPYTHAAPAATLEREVPSGDAISARLGSLKRSLEMRVVTPRQHSMERSVILEALLPSAPRTRRTPLPPPSDVIAAAGMIGQLERLRFEGVISDLEFTQERAAIDGYLMTGEMLGIEMTEDSMPAENITVMSEAPKKVSGLGLHLASYRSQQAAETGWKSISKKHANQLGSLNSAIRRVNLGANKGTFYRLMAVPVADRAEANTICQQLKRSNQYCDPLSVGG